MILPYLRLVRVGALFSPAADVLAGACLVGLAWSADLVGAMLASVCVYAAGMALNDHADRAEDARNRPERPLPSGQIPASRALALGLVLLGAALLLTPVWQAHAALGAGVLAYDYLLKRHVPSAALTMGLLRGGNLLTGAVVGVGGAFPDARAVHAAALAYVAYIVAVTILGSYEDDRNVSPRAVDSVQTVPPIAAVMALLAAPEPTPAVWIGIVLAVVFLRARQRRSHQGWDQAAIRRSMTWLLLGTMLFTALLCLASGRPWEALGVALAVLPARWISRRIALT